MTNYNEQIKKLRNYASFTAIPPMSVDLSEAANAIEQLEAAVPRWIPVTERLPHEELLGIRVLCCLKSKDVEWVGIRLFMNGKFHHPKGQKGKVTHWMPLPEPPKEVQT